jgi:hypothetical protein
MVSVPFEEGCDLLANGGCSSKKVRKSELQLRKVWVGHFQLLSARDRRVNLTMWMQGYRIGDNQ